MTLDEACKKIVNFCKNESDMEKCHTEVQTILKQFAIGVTMDSKVREDAINK